MGFFNAKPKEPPAKWKLLGTVEHTLQDNSDKRMKQWGTLYFHCFESDGGQRKYTVTAYVLEKSNHSHAISCSEMVTTFSLYIYRFLHGADISDQFIDFDDEGDPDPKSKEPLPEDEEELPDNVVSLNKAKAA